MLSIKESLLLEHLVTYHALTNEHLVRLGIGQTTKSANNNYVSPLRYKGLIQTEVFGTIPGKGRLADFHFLTVKGVQVVSEILRCDPSEIYYPKSLKFKDDYYHRKQFIMFHILLRLWIEGNEERELEFIDPYYIRTKQYKARSINQFLFRASLVTAQ